MTDLPPTHDLDVILEVFESLPHCRELGMKVVDVGFGQATMRLDYQDRLIGNPETGTLHGGVVTTLLDTACGFAVFARIPKGTSLATLDLRIDYLKPARAHQPLFVRAECYKLTTHVAFARGLAYNSSPDDPIATAVGTFMANTVGFSITGSGEKSA